uniref:Uncharacterized protein n=1 Tax=Arundo donax TaxID=35708 RepID=A0A0A8ZKV6_ARUDO
MPLQANPQTSRLGWNQPNSLSAEVHLFYPIFSSLPPVLFCSCTIPFVSPLLFSSNSCFIISWISSSLLLIVWDFGMLLDAIICGPSMKFAGSTGK